MKPIQSIIIISLFLISSLQAQTPEIVTDFNVGPDDSFNSYNYKGITYNESIILPITSSEFGIELAIIKDGSLSFLKDLNVGIEPSNPNHFIEFNGLVYFSAYDDTNGGSIWSTDGTAENTIVVFSFGTSSIGVPEGLIPSGSGFIYYSYSDKLYRNDGITNEELQNGVRLWESDQHRSKNYCKYNDEVAFVETDGNNLKLYLTGENSPIELGSIPASGSFNYLFGLNEVNQGLIFGVENPFDADASGSYVYDTSSESINKLNFSGAEVRRIHNFNDDKALMLVFGDGYYTSNGDQNSAQLLFPDNSSSTTQGVGIIHNENNDKILFQASGGTFGSSYIIHTDGTSAGSKQLFEVEQYMSNIFTWNNYAFLASGTTNGFKPEFYYVNLDNGSFVNFYNSDLGSWKSKSVLFVGALDNKIYFINGLHEDVGRELYSIDLDFFTEVNNELGSNIKVKFTSNSFSIIADNYSTAKLKIYSLDGKLLESKSCQTNQEYELSHLSGMIILRFELDNSVASYKLYVK